MIHTYARARMCMCVYAYAHLQFLIKNYFKEYKKDIYE